MLRLAERLRALRYRVWLDSTELKWGDDLSSKIDHGLTRSRFGIVILSRHFFAKSWPTRELSGLVQREILGRTKIILPLLHEIDHAYVANYSPTLAGKLSLSTSDIDAVVAAAADVLGPVPLLSPSDGSPVPVDSASLLSETVPPSRGRVGDQGTAGNTARWRIGGRFLLTVLIVISALLAIGLRRDVERRLVVSFDPDKGIGASGFSLDAPVESDASLNRLWAVAPNRFKLWDLTSARLMLERDQTNYAIVGDWYLGLAANRRLEAIDLESGRSHRPPFAPEGLPEVGVAPEGYLVHRSGTGLKLWNLHERREAGSAEWPCGGTQHVVHELDTLHAVRWVLPGVGMLLDCSSNGGGGVIWVPLNGTRPQALEARPSGFWGIVGTAIDKPKSLMAIQTGSLSSTSVSLWSMPPDHKLATFDVWPEHTQVQLSFLKEAGLLLVGSLDYPATRVALIDLRTRTVQRFSPDVKLLEGALYSSSGQDLTKHNVPPELAIPPSLEISTLGNLEWSPSGDRALLTRRSHREHAMAEVELWKTEPWRRIATFGGVGATDAAHFTGDDKAILLSSEMAGTLSLFAATTGQAILTVTDLGASPTAVSFDPDCRRVHFWTATGRLVRYSMGWRLFGLPLRLPYNGVCSG